jgi:hypothetical protein
MICREQETHTSGHTEHPLAIGEGRQDVVDHVRCGIAHAPCRARWTKAAPLARERYEFFVWAFRAFDSHKASSELATIEILLEFTADKGRVAETMFASLLRLREANVEVSTYDVVQDRFFRLTTLVGRWG